VLVLVVNVNSLCCYNKSPLFLDDFPIQTSIDYGRVTSNSSRSLQQFKTHLRSSVPDKASFNRIFFGDPKMGVRYQSVLYKAIEIRALNHIPYYTLVNLGKWPVNVESFGNPNGSHLIS
jgi:hypothetical protein